MNLSHRIDNQICIITLSGELADIRVDDANTYVQNILDNETFNAMIMDLDKVSFIDSSGLGLLVTTYETLKARKAKFALYHLTRKNKAIFRLTHVDQFLNIYSTEAEAIAHL